MRTKRLAARLRDYDWMAVIIELIIVVLGILIALKVSDWNQERLNHRRAESDYRRIHADLLADRHNMDVTLAYWRKVSAYGSAAIAYGESGALVDGSAWKTVLAYYQASQVMPFVASDNTFEEMRGAGDLGLIADPRLRGRLEDYYSLSGVGAESIIHEQNPAYRIQVRGLTPWPVQQYIWNHCYRETSYNAQRFIDCPPPVGDRDAAAILAVYRKSPTLLDHLRAWMSTLRISEIVLVNTRKDSATLAAEVAAAQKR